MLPKCCGLFGQESALLASVSDLHIQWLWTREHRVRETELSASLGGFVGFSEVIPGFKKDDTSPRELR